MKLLLLFFIFVLSTICMAQENTEYEDSLFINFWFHHYYDLMTLDTIYEKPDNQYAEKEEPALEVRVCIDEAYGLVIIIDGGFFEKWRKLKAKYYTDIRIEFPDTAIDLSYNEFVKRIKKEE